MLSHRERSGLRAGLRTVWRLLGSPQAVSWTLGWWYLPFGLVGPLLIDRARLGGSGLAWLAIALAGQAVLMAGFAVLGPIAGRVRERLRPLANVAVMLVVLMMRGLTLAMLADAAGLTQGLEFRYRLGGALIAQFGMVATLSVVAGAYDGHRRLAAQLAGQRRQLAEIDASMRERIEETTRLLIARVRESVDPLVAKLDAQLMRIRDGSPSGGAAVEINRLVDEELRPFSHRLAAEGGEAALPAPLPAQSRRIPLPSHLRIGDTFDPWVLGILAALVSLSQALRVFAPPTALVFPAITGACVFAVLWTFRRAFGDRVLPLALMAIVLSAITGGALWAAILVERTLRLPVPENVSTAGLVVGLILGAAACAYAAVTSRLAATRAELEAAIGSLDHARGILRQHDFATRRRLSYLLHGSLQSALHAAAMRLAADPAPSAQLIAEVRADIEAAMAKLDAPEPNGVLIVDTLSDIAELWDGSCTVRWTLDHRTLRTLTDSPAAASSVLEITRECVSNAIRHGGATDIWVTIAGTGDHVMVTVLDNGLGSGRSTGAGLGSAMLDELTSAWTRTPLTNGTAVEARVPVTSALPYLAP